MRSAPFPPLVAGSEGLERRPVAPDALRRRMAEVYGVREAELLPVRGALHGAELALRLMAPGGVVAGAERADWRQLARIYRASLGGGAKPALRLVASPGFEGEPALTEADALNAAPGVELLVIDESLIEFADAASLAAFATRCESAIVLRDLSFAYGLAGAPCGALIASEATIARLEAVLEPNALASPVVKLALAALDPTRVSLNDARIAEVKTERARMQAALAGANVGRAEASAGPFVYIAPRNDEAAAALRRAGVDAPVRADGALRLDVRQRAANDRVLSALGAAIPFDAGRVAEVVRETLETRIAVRVDLDGGPRAAIDTGIGYFDHMLAQVATHGGFSIALTCKGDLEVDAHHTIEDCALALGQALKQALGDKRGIARYGFLLPMDEAEAKVSIDLGGRAYDVFEGVFAAPLIGAYPTEMTEHVFRSLAQSMGAAIHVAVTGENDHHKTEACFKAFGRALRQATRIESAETPSTKGVI